MTGGQLELEFGTSPVPANSKELLPVLEISPGTTPGEINRWWDKLVVVFDEAAREAQTKAEPLEHDIRGLKGKRDKASRLRVAQLREGIAAIFCSALKRKDDAYALFESTLEAFAPKLREIFRALNVSTEDDYTSETEEFWQCLQRPDIEHNADVQLSEVARVFARSWDGLGEREEDAGAPEEVTSPA